MPIDVDAFSFANDSFFPTTPTDKDNSNSASSASKLYFRPHCSTTLRITQVMLRVSSRTTTSLKFRFNDIFFAFTTFFYSSAPLNFFYFLPFFYFTLNSFFFHLWEGGAKPHPRKKGATHLAPGWRGPHVGPIFANTEPLSCKQVSLPM